MENKNGLFRLHEDTRSGILADVDIPSRTPSIANDTRTLVVKLTDGSVIEIGDVATLQPKDATLTALSTKPTKAFGIGALDILDGAAFRTYIGAGTSNFDGVYGSLSTIPDAISSIDHLVPAANKLVYYTSTNTAALADFSATGRSLVAAADSAAARTAVGAGTVSSVALTMPSIFAVAGSPVTGSGTLVATLASQAANLVFASPSGTAGAPAMIALAASHIPNLDWAKITSGKPTTLAGYGIADAQAKSVDLDAISAISTTGYLSRTGSGLWSVSSTAAPSAHKTSHHAGGADELALASIMGGRPVDSPTFAGLLLKGNVLVDQDTFFAANSVDGNEQSMLSLCGGGSTAVSRGAAVHVRGNERPTSGGTLSLAAGDGIQGNIEMSTGGTLRVAITKAGEMNVASGSLRVGSMTGFAYMASGLIRQATNSDFPGTLSTLASLANADGVLRNTGAGVLSWSPALPTKSYSTTGLGLFGGVGKPSASAYLVATDNIGVGMADARSLAWRGALVSSDEFWGLWQDASLSTSFKPFVLGDGAGNVWYKNDPLSGTAKHFFTGLVQLSAGVNANGGSFQVAGTDAITSGRAGRLTSLRVADLTQNYVPRIIDANGTLGNSGISDDATFVSIDRILRLWNTMAKAGNTWTDLQWAQDANERVSTLSSNSTGQYAYHTLVFVPADGEVTGRVLGGTLWGQKVAGKSAAAAGLKAGMFAKSVGVGGSNGGFGGQLVVNYRPDNGANLVDALRIGAFSGGVSDGIEAVIPLRATADVYTTFLSIRNDSHTSPGIDILSSGASYQAHFRIISDSGDSLFGNPAGAAEVSASSRLTIGVPGTGRGKATFELGLTEISYPKLQKSLRTGTVERTGSATTGVDDITVAYSGEGGHTETLPLATGSGRIIIYSNIATTVGTWTLQRAGTDVIFDGGNSTSTSVSILTAAMIRSRIYQDVLPGKWMRLN